MCEGVFNIHNSQFRVRGSVHPISEREYEVRFSVSVSTGIVGESVMGLYLLLNMLSAQRYYDFLVTVLSGLLAGVPLTVRQRFRLCGFSMAELKSDMIKDVW
jgi:hypothetical protein